MFQRNCVQAGDQATAIRGKPANGQARGGAGPSQGHGGDRGSKVVLKGGEGEGGEGGGGGASGQGLHPSGTNHVSFCSSNSASRCPLHTSRGRCRKLRTPCPAGGKVEASVPSGLAPHPLCTIKPKTAIRWHGRASID